MLAHIFNKTFIDLIYLLNSFFCKWIENSLGAENMDVWVAFKGVGTCGCVYVRAIFAGGLCA